MPAKNKSHLHYIRELQGSSHSVDIAVADHLMAVAGNGDEQASRLFLGEEALAMSDCARDVAETLVPERKKYARVAWVVDDVLAIAPQLSRKRAISWLQNNEGRIQDSLVEKGNEVIAQLLDYDGIKTLP